MQEQVELEKIEDYESRSLDLKTFVNKWVYDIFSWDILENIHSRFYQSKCKNWLYKYRKKGLNITLYKKQDIVLYINRIKDAIRAYQSNQLGDSSDIDIW